MQCTRRGHRSQKPRNKCNLDTVVISVTPYLTASAICIIHVCVLSYLLSFMDIYNLQYMDSRFLGHGLRIWTLVFQLKLNILSKMALFTAIAEYVQDMDNIYPFTFREHSKRLRFIILRSSIIHYSSKYLIYICYYLVELDLSSNKISYISGLTSLVLKPANR